MLFGKPVGSHWVHRRDVGSVWDVVGKPLGKEWELMGTMLGSMGSHWAVTGAVVDLLWSDWEVVGNCSGSLWVSKVSGK